MKNFFCISVFLLVFTNGLTFGQFTFTANKITDSIFCAPANDSVLITLTSSNQIQTDTTYKWNFGNDSSSTGVPAHVVYRSGIYSVLLTKTVSNNPTISIKETRTLFIRPHPNAYFTVADTIISGKNLDYIFRSGKAPDSILYKLNSATKISNVRIDSIYYSYTWNLMDSADVNSIYTHSHNSDISIIYTYRDTLTYNFASEGRYNMHLKVNDYFGCTDNYYSMFYVSQKLKIPNAFTPNGDGQNDYFHVQTNGRTVYSLKIFTQTGLLIFDSKSKSILWDGMSNSGSPVVSGTYYYVIEPVENAEGQAKRIGFLVLFR
jgi:gliding motility-associated-like protein